MMPVTADFMLDALCLSAFSNTPNTKRLLESVIEVYMTAKLKNPDIVDTDLEIFFTIIKDIVESDINLERKAEINRILIKVKKSPVGIKDPKIVDRVESILTNTDNISPRRITILSKRIKNWIVWSRMNSNLREMFGKCQKFSLTDDVTNDILLNDIFEYAKEISTANEAFGDVSAQNLDCIDMGDKLSILKAVQAYRNKRKSYVFKMGIQGLSRMFGKNKGLVAGEFVAFGASSHNYKSGILTDMTRWLCTCNGKIPAPAGMTPTVVLISLENDVTENTIEFFRAAYVNAYKQVPPPDMPDETVIDFVFQYYNKNGVKFLMYRFDNEFSYTDFVSLMSELKNKGHYVFATVIDYLTLVNKDDLAAKYPRENAPKLLQILANRFYNYAKANNMLIVTALQLDSDADRINTTQSNAVRHYGASNLGDCKGLKRELDVLIWMHIEKNHQGDSYLTFAFEKHRGEPPPPKEDVYCAYKFDEVLGILDDCDGQDMSRQDIYSDIATVTEGKASTVTLF